MNNLAAKIIPKKIRSIEEAKMLSEYIHKAVNLTEIEQQNFKAANSKITNRDIIFANWAKDTNRIFDTLSKNLDRDFDLAMERMGLKNVEIN